jgi:Ni/Fe-hydrogenase subunit HybB-like protein
MTFGRPLEHRLMRTLGRFSGGAILVFLVVRFAILALEGKLGLTFGAGRLGFFFWGEVLIFLLAAAGFLVPGTRARPDQYLGAALMAMLGGVLYRLDVFLVAYDPGNGWVYFPSVGEILVTLGLIATETVVYVVVVRRFPILAGVTPAPERGVPAGLKEGATT